MVRKNGEKALKWAIDFAQQVSAEVALVGVVDLGLNHWMLDEGVISQSNHVFVDDAKKIMQQATEKVTSAGLRAKEMLLEGDPATVLIETAEQEKMDIIVCGAKGKGGLAKLVLGSIANKLVSFAPIPVIVVK